jgi:GrpB-like predicted nucleotidyltransferase (UPF0157 family)
MDGKMIEIIAYKNGWPLEFRQIAFPLRQGLGPLALRIDHIGSTAVPGLAAKDVIDIQISVAAFNPELLSALESLGYSRLEDFRSDHRPARAGGADLEWQKWFFYPPSGQRRTNTHIRMQGRGNQRYALIFRDYLRAHPATAETYGELKRRLAQNLSDLSMYAEVKDPAVDLIYLAAEEWATSSKWEPGPSDA